MKARSINKARDSRLSPTGKIWTVMASFVCSLEAIENPVYRWEGKEDSHDGEIE